MKTRLLAIGLLPLVAVAASRDDKITLSRTYLADQVASYAVQIEQGLGASQVSLTLQEHVLKVNSDGSADCELKATQITRLMNGVPGTPSDGKPMSARFDRAGALVSAQGGLMTIPFLVGGAYGVDSGIVPGQVVKFDRQDPTASDVRLKGTMRLTTVADGNAVITVTADRVDVKTGPFIHVEGTFTYRVKDANLMKSDIWVTELRRPHSGKSHIVSELQTG